MRLTEVVDESTSVRWRSWESVYITIQPLILNLIGLPATFYIISRQGDTNFGYWATAASITAALTVFGSLGMRPLFVRAVAQDRGSAAVRLGEQITLRFLLSFLATILSLTTCLALRYPPVVIICVAVASVGSMLAAIGDALTDTLHAFERFAAQSNVFLFSGLSLTAASIIVCWLGMGPVALTLSYVIAPALNVTLMTLVIVRQHFRFYPRWNLKRFREVLTESRLLSRNFILLSVHDRVEQLILPKFVTPGQFGQFSAGLMPASRLNAVPSGVTTVFYPRIARACVHETCKRDPLVQNLFLALLCTCPPTALGVVFFGPWIAQILFARDPLLCQRVIQITMWSLPTVGIAWAMQSSLQASGHHDRQAVAGIKASLISIAVGSILVMNFGVYGACVSWVMRPLVSCVVLFRPFREAFPGLLRRLPFVRVALAMGAMQGVLTEGAWLLGDQFVGLCVVGFVGSVTFYGVLILLNVISSTTLAGFIAKPATQIGPPIESASEIHG